MKKAIVKFLTHPRFTLVISIAMIASAIWDLLEISSKRVLGFELGSEHGVALAGVMHLAKALADADEGAEKFIKGKEEEAELEARSRRGHEVSTTEKHE